MLEHDLLLQTIFLANRSGEIILMLRLKKEWWIRSNYYPRWRNLQPSLPKKRNEYKTKI
jgi:hypothetical protein